MGGFRSGLFARGSFSRSCGGYCLCCFCWGRFIVGSGGGSAIKAGTGLGAAGGLEHGW